ncbi:hypothetical protein AVEN_58858-1 [Araneus ventricosus]|uniref:FAD dependent oxidoreductase domain-containing protein n=1 Tax=Araneus ventricosus TaxID=182803 RepID=A0A4Y2MFC8_ARAVE|nr:hypothetical protein AVEN_58858-1 [Araneus ventricosus]
MYQGSNITPTAHVPYHHKGSTRLNSPLLTNRVYGLMMLSPYSYMCIRPIQLETRLIRPGNVFPVINSPMTDDCDCRIFDDNGAGYVSARRLVKAQQKMARLQGCEIIEDIVREVKDLHEGVHQVITEKNGIIRAKRVLICAGAFTNYIRLQPVGRVKMVINKETVAMLRLSEKEAEILRTMPAMTYLKRRDDLPILLNGVYILPPMQYPDGHYYLKAGRNGINSTEPSLEEVNEWYNSRGDLEIVEQLSYLLKQLLPNANFEGVSSKTCLTSHNETGLPYIDHVTPTVTVAVVGNGVGAAICDEVGRIAAELSTSGEWDSELPRNLFEAVLE